VGKTHAQQKKKLQVTKNYGKKGFEKDLAGLFLLNFILKKSSLRLWRMMDIYSFPNQSLNEGHQPFQSISHVHFVAEKLVKHRSLGCPFDRSSN